MAKIFEERINIKLSRIVKDDSVVETSITKELLETIETVVSELVGDHIIVEITE